jgi:hypothetical protein
MVELGRRYCADGCCKRPRAAPDLTGVGVRERLDRLDQGRFAALSQRTIQRAVKAVRTTQARRVVAETAALLG